jgi:alpha-mannosidase
MSSSPLEVHIVSHTHWDREWYLPAGRFRQRLVPLIDDLLDDPPDRVAAFLLDGQAIVLEDYLAVRPERASEVAASLKDGGIEAGPWYVLADELIPSAEALVRNLLAGRRALSSLRARSPRVLYCPDSFGHPAALPELANGFGFETIVLWRGYGGRRWPAGDCVRWRAPSGATALLYHLPRDGYEYGSHLPLGEQDARDRWSRIRTELGGRSALGVVLLPHGADHHARQHRWRDALELLENVAQPDAAHASSMSQFVESLEQRAEGATLSEVTGELRDSYGYTWTLQGTFATRAQQKRRNALAERLLIREAEPWSALARLHGAPSRRSLIEAAWKTLLQCHPHDTLCGCSIDEVSRAMDARLDDVMGQGAGIRDDSVQELIGHDAADARARSSEWRSVVHVRNAAPRPRGGVVHLVLARKLVDVPVGPGSVSLPPAMSAASAEVGLAGVPAQYLGSWQVHERIESPRHYPDNDLVELTFVAALLSPVPSLGVVVLPLGERAERHTAVSGDTVLGDADGIESNDVRVNVDDVGNLTLRVNGRTIEAFASIESTDDLGDLYTPSIRSSSVRTDVEQAFVTHAGPLHAALQYNLVLRRHDETMLSVGEVNLTFVLDAGAPFLRIIVQGRNGERDHRLRIVLATEVRDPDVWADAAFGQVRRVPLVLAPEEMIAETPPATAPLHRYVSLFGREGGATLYSDGLAEYEVMPDGRIAITLVRAVGQLSRNDIPERPGHAGWPTDTPEAQCLGEFEASLALMFHGGVRDAPTIDLIERTADDVLVPLAGETLRSAIDVRDAQGFELSGTGLAFSAVKDSADGEWIVFRCLNLLDEPVEGSWRMPLEIREAMKSRLDESPLEELGIVDGHLVRFTAGPREVVTILVR